MSDIPVTVLNDATGQNVVYVGTAATLDVTLTNQTGEPIGLVSGAAASTLTIFLPDYYDDAALEAMQVALDGWELGRPGGALVLTFTGTNGTSWAPGTNLAFAIAGALSTAAPAVDQSLQINPAGLTGYVPTQLDEMPLVLSNPPKPGNASLRGVLALSLDDQGSVYVSQPNDPLQSTLFLNLKNVGKTPLYAGQSMWSGSPQVKVRFVYGSTAEALAPAGARQTSAPEPVGSAWNIQGAIQTMPQLDTWSVTNPYDAANTDSIPTWVLEPTSTNKDVLGVGDAANLTIALGPVISFTEPGHTQAVVDLKGFMQDDATAYDEAVYVLDIVKQSPPPTRGALAFAGPDPVVVVTDPTQPVQVRLRWTMFDVAQVNLITSFPGVPLWSKTYPNFAPLDYDTCTVTLPPTAQSMPVTFTLQSFDGAGGYLNSQQFTVFLQSLVFVDPRDARAYPVLLVGDTYWLAANLDFAAPGSLVYGAEATYGRLYPNQTLAAAVPPGWRIPSANDWQALSAAFGYAGLIAGGASGFGAQLGGWYTGGGYAQQGTYGYYWTSTPGAGNTVTCASFSARSATVSTASTVPPAYGLAVRLVRDV